MKKLMAIAAVAAVCCAAVADEPAEGAKRPGRPGMMGGDPFIHLVANPKVAAEIGLSAEQQAKAKELLKGDKEADKARQQKLRAAMERQMTLLKADKVDEAAVMAAIDEAFDLRREMAKNQTKKLIGVKSLLTPEQMQKAREAAKNFRANRPEGKARRPGARKGDGPKPADCGEGDKPCAGEGAAPEAK